MHGSVAQSGVEFAADHLVGLARFIATVIEDIGHHGKIGVRPEKRFTHSGWRAFTHWAGTSLSVNDASVSAYGQSAMTRP